MRTTGNNRYDLQSLKLINGSYDYQHGISESDVEMVNKWIDRIESTRSTNIPKAGDRINYTSPHGDYSDRAIIEKSDKIGLYICIHPHVPFVMESRDSIYYSVSGGPFTRIPHDKLKYVGKTKTFFNDWGWCCACANGAVCFEVEVSLWEFIEPEPLYGSFTTKSWRRIYFHKNSEEQLSKEGYLYTSDGIAFKTEEEFSQFLKQFKATVFPGNWSSQIVVWCYRNILESISPEEWDKLDIPVSTWKYHSSKNIVKSRYDDNAHTLVSYYASEYNLASK